MKENIKAMPTVGMEAKEVQEPTAEKKSPAPSRKTKNMPTVGVLENTVMIGGKSIEIKPTKLKYHRNNTASFYRVIDLVPLPEILSYPAGAFGDERDGDKALMDWLIAVTDDEELIVENYNEMDTAVIEQMLEIFKRINKITEKEEKQKNAQSRVTAE